MKKIVLISSYCDTDEKIEILKSNIDTIKSLGLDVMLNSPLSLPLDLINKCDYFFLTKDNPILEWPEKAVYVWNSSIINGKTITKNRCFSDYGWANIYQIKKLSEFALTYDYDQFYHIIYDLIIDDIVIDGFNSDKKCNFYHFHEHNVSLQLMIFDREHLIKFLNQLTLNQYLNIGGIAEQWLDGLLKMNFFDYTIEDHFVDDKVLFHGHSDLHNYSKIDGLKFFIIKNTLEQNVRLFFYDNADNLEININNYINFVYNGDFIDLGDKNNISNVIIKFNEQSQDITELISSIIHNTIDIN
jgi:hypothetical protein